MKKLLIVATLALSTGCASIVSDSNYDVMVSSDERIKVKVMNSKGHPIASGHTPLVISLDSSEGFFSGASYSIDSECNTGIIDSTLDPWYFGNLLFGGFIGALVVDPATGAMWKIPSNVYINC